MLLAILYKESSNGENYVTNCYFNSCQFKMILIHYYCTTLVQLGDTRLLDGGRKISTEKFVSYISSHYPLSSQPIKLYSWASSHIYEEN